MPETKWEVRVLSGHRFELIYNDAMAWQLETAFLYAAEIAQTAFGGVEVELDVTVNGKTVHFHSYAEGR